MEGIIDYLFKAVDWLISSIKEKRVSGRMILFIVIIPTILLTILTTIVEWYYWGRDNVFLIFLEVPIFFSLGVFILWVITPDKEEENEEGGVGYLYKDDPEQIKYWGPKIYLCPHCSKINHIRDGHVCINCDTKLTQADIKSNPYL